LTSGRGGGNLHGMAIRWSRPRAAVAILLLALLAVPIAREALADTDSHQCCPESAPATESPMPCQYLVPLGCCAQLGLPATAAGDGPRLSPVAFELVAFTPPAAPPRVRSLAHAGVGHWPPQALYLRTIVLRL